MTWMALQDSIASTMLGLIGTAIVSILLANQLTAVVIPKRTPRDIESALVRHGVVPKCIKKAPQHMVEVAYGEKVVDFGTNLTSKEITNEPTHITWPADKHTLYTLMLIGPDVPTHENPEDRNCQHWIVTNVPGNKISSGFNLSEYVGILSFYDYGIHRLVFLVYKQPEKTPLNFTEPIREKKIIGYMRAFFHHDVFSDKYNLGEPIAANFFLVQINPFPYNLSSVQNNNQVDRNEDDRNRDDSNKYDNYFANLFY